MRDLIRYPVTDDEIITTLEQIEKDLLDQQCVGDLRAYILSLVINHVKSNPIASSDK